MEKPRENKKEMQTKGLIKLKNKKENICCVYKSLQNQNSSVSFCENDFPSLSEVGLKSNSNDKSLLSIEKPLTYSARVKVLPQNDQPKSEKFYSGCNYNLPSSSASNSVQSHSNIKKINYTSKVSQVIKDEPFTDKSVTNIDFSEQCSNFQSYDFKTDITKSLTPSNRYKATEIEVEDESEWTIVKSKSSSDRNVLKDNVQLKYKKFKMDKNSSNSQCNKVPHNFNQQKFNDQNVDINQTRKRPNIRENFNNQNKYSSVNKRSEFSLTENPHVQSAGRKHLFPGMAQDKYASVHARFNDSNKEHNTSHTSAESKNKMRTHENHIVKRPNLKNNFSNINHSCRSEFSQCSENENFSNSMTHRNSNKKSAIKNEHSEWEFNASSKTSHKSNLKENSEYFQVNKTAQLPNKALSSSNVLTNKNRQPKGHSSLNKNSYDKTMCPSSENIKSHHSTSSINSNKTNKQNNTQAINTLVPSKKKRKSKVKRQAALQSDKIRLITPETFSKILNQKNSVNTQSQNTTSVNIGDCEEYPELGSVATSKCNLESNVSNRINLKRETPILSKTCGFKVEKSNTLLTEETPQKPSCASPDIVIKVNELNQSECEVDEEKMPVHIKDPITISIFDMLQVNKNKKKDTEKNSDPVKISPSKMSSKKLLSYENRHFVNPLGSSKPAVKRGKEREKPKPKKISQLKKIILMDRKKRKESKLSIMRENSVIAEKDDLLKNDTSFLNFNKSVINEINLELSNQTYNEMNNNVTSLYEQPDSNACNYIHKEFENINSKMQTNIHASIQSINLEATNSLTMDCDTVVKSNNCMAVDSENICSSRSENCLKSNMTTDALNDVYSTKSYELLMSKKSKNLDIPNIKSYLTACDKTNVAIDNILFDIRLLFDSKNKFIFNEKNKLRRHNCEHALNCIRYLFKYPNIDQTFSKGEVIPALKDIRYLFEDEIIKLDEDTPSTDEPLSEDQNLLINHRYSEKEVLEASLALLHSKKFRSYCTHFLSKELEDAVYVLLDDLARFQDRMHQKDPVKARMKRRLLYGIREIKRHMKLKKLKCIIIATDVEDSKTEGGLNDILNDLKSLAKDYQIPCVFSHLRRKLGYVCHKSAPVSAVGIFNYEGSEVNFKKMLELQSVCKSDYDEVIKSLTSKLTNEQIDLICKTINEDMSNLHIVVNAVLRTFFPNPVSKNSATNRSSKNASSTDCNSNDEIASISSKIHFANQEISPEMESNSTVEDLKDTEEAFKIYGILQKYKCINY